MAAIVNYNNDNPDIGIYGIYNRFIVNISTGEQFIFNHQFRIRVTVANDSSLEIIKNIDSVQIGSQYYANPNPIESLRELFFESEYTGFSESTATKSYSKVTIQIGEVYSDTEDVAPTFRGYDTEDSFYFYNGYEKPETAQQLIGLNYREEKWYNETPHLLPKVKKTLYLLEEDIELLSIPSFLNVYPPVIGLTTNLKNLVTEYYDSSNTLISTSTIDLSARPDLNDVGYWNININSIFPNNTKYALVYVQWIIDGESILVDSEQLKIFRLECNPKSENYRLRWINRYSGEEFQNFQLKADKSSVILRGKKISSTGINYAATTFNDIANINNPNIKEYGNESFTRWKLRTDFITQEEINAMEELFKDNSVILFNPEIGTVNNTQPVIVENRNYSILDVRQNLQRIEINVRLADIEPNQI